MKYLYKYPQRAFPYADLVETNRKRGKLDFEYELLDTGIFAEDRCFDVVVEYAKAGPTDLLVRISATNRGLDAATLQLLPTLWFRNRWSWFPGAPKPDLHAASSGADFKLIEAAHPKLETYWLACAGAPALLFTENETNMQRLYGAANASPYVKDGIDARVVHGRQTAVNPQQRGTKVAAQYVLSVAAGRTSAISLRLSNAHLTAPFGAAFDATFATRKAEADAFYARITPYEMSDDMRNIQRQAFAGLLWNKQYYEYDVARWLDGDPAGPPPPAQRRNGRGAQWRNLTASDVFSMPDKWGCPWFAAWDLGFHAIAVAMIDPDLRNVSSCS
jgi:hypothetical protein